MGNNPSYTWRSLWSAKALVMEGSRWRVGRTCGFVTRNPFYVRPRAEGIPLDIMVGNLIDHDEVCEILRIPLDDKPKRTSWYRRYYVKYAYNLYRKLFVNNVHLVMLGDRMSIWKIRASLKVGMDKRVDPPCVRSACISRIGSGLTSLSCILILIK